MEHETKDRVTRTPLKTRGELRCSGMVSSSFVTQIFNNGQPSHGSKLPMLKLKVLFNACMYIYIYLIMRDFDIYIYIYIYIVKPIQH